MAVEFLSVAEARIAYQRQIGDTNKPGLVFLCGYGSDMTARKATFLAKKCAAESVSFVRFDYRGCGQSSGNFTDGTIGLWLQDSLTVLDRLTNGSQIIIGSSMGGWLGLLLIHMRPQRVKAFIGIAAAPDFTEELIWKNLGPEQREVLLREGQMIGSHVPMTLKLIQEAREHLVFRAPLAVSCPIRLLQGMKDTEVPWQYAQRISDHLVPADTQVTFVKNGDHSLSMPENLDLLWDMIAAFL